MYSEEFRAILVESVKVSLKDRVFFLLVVVLISVFIDFDVKKTGYHQSKKERSRNRVYSAMFLFGIALTVIMTLSTQLSVFRDMQSENYICVHGKYVREREHASASTGNNTVVVFLDGEETGMGLEMPRVSSSGSAVDNERFPVTEGYGTIWYTGNSKYILKYIPDDP